MQFLKLIILLPVFFFASGCATATKCASQSAEPVSSCRAEAACGRGSFGNVFGTLLAGFNPTNTPNRAVANYNDCVDRDLRAQQSNAGVRSNSYVCRSEETSPGEYRAQCDQR